MVSRIPEGSVFGIHAHAASREINYVLSGKGKAGCDGQEQMLRPGTARYRPWDSANSSENKEKEGLVMFTVVP